MEKENKVIEATCRVVADRTPDVIALEINTIKDQTAKVIIMNSIEIGRRLSEAKGMLPHGEWGTWLKEKVDYSQDTAGNLMRIFTEYGADQIDLFGTANSETFRNLGYSQAVALLAIPRDEREEFIEDVGAEDLSVRKLEEEIKKWKNGKEVIENLLKDAEGENSTLKKDIEVFELQVTEKEKEIERLQKELEEAKDVADIASETAREALKVDEEDTIGEKADEIARTLREAEEKYEQANKELEALKTSQNELKETHEAMIAEARRQGAQDAEAKLGFKSNKEVNEFGVHVKEFQEKYNKAIGLLTAIYEVDAEKANQLRTFLKNIVEGYLDWLEG